MKKIIIALVLIATATLAFASGSDKAIVCYFSCTGNTEHLAKKAADALSADLYEIVPEEPYTSADLNYGASSSRTSKENADPSSRPEIKGGAPDLSGYGIIVIAHPIWWGKAPRIIQTFVESQDFSGKRMTTIATSGSSSIGSSQNVLREATKGATWFPGRRFSSSVTVKELNDFFESSGIR